MPNPDISQDKRLMAAHRIYERHKKGVIKVFKTVRAGATSSLLLEAFMRNEKTVIVVSTHDEADKTVLKTFIELCKKYGEQTPKVVKVQSNHRCQYNVEILDSLPFENPKHAEYVDLLIKPRREQCGEECLKYEECEVMDIVRAGDIADVIVLVHAKLSNVKRKPKNKKSKSNEEDESEGLNAFILAQLLSAKNIIIDESHKIEQSESVGSVVQVATLNNNTWEIKKINIIQSKYLALLNDPKYKEIANVIKYFAKIITNTDVLNAISEVTEEAKQKKFHSTHVKKEMTNPLEKLRSDVVRKKDLVVFPALVDACHTMIVSDDYLKYCIFGTELQKLMDYASIINSKQIHITASKTDDDTLISISLANDRIDSIDLIREFLKVAQEGERRIIFTTGTFGSFNYKKFFKKGTRIINVLFGRHGDPMATVAKHRIFNYSMPLSSNGYWKASIKSNLTQICDIVVDAIALFGTDIFVCTINHYNASLIHDALDLRGYDIEVHYYQGPDTQGVQCDARFGIFISGGYIPVFAKHGSTENYQEAYKKSREHFFCVTWQTVERVKCPDGLERSASLVIMQDTDVKEMNEFVNRFDRKTGKSLISMPRVDDVGVDIQSGLRTIRNYLITSAAGSTPPNAENPAGKIHENFEDYGQQSNCSREKLLCKRRVSFSSVLNITQGQFPPFCSKTEQPNEREKRQGFEKPAEESHPLVELDAPNSESCKKEPIGFTDSEWRRHKAGKEPLYAEIIDKNDNVRFLTFKDLNVSELKRISDCMKDNDMIGVVIQKVLYTYDIWVFVEPVKAGKAKELARNIMKEANVKCEYYPNYSDRKSALRYSNNKIRLPLNNGELVARDGKFANDIWGMEIWLNDLSPYEEHKPNFVYEMDSGLDEMEEYAD